MALAFGRARRRSRGDAAFPHSLIEHARLGATGVVEVQDRRTSGRARLALFRGGVYAIALDGFEADPLRRLITAGILNADAAASLAAVHRPEVEAVRRGLVTVDALASVHQEFLLASWGAVLAAEIDADDWQQDRVLDTGCTLPLPVADVMAAAELRSQRMATTWAAVCSSAGPEIAVLAPIDEDASLPSTLPEMAAVARALDGRSTVDQVAGRLGLTRAEAVHLTAALVGAGLTAWQGQRGEVSRGRLVVPEEFGQRVVVPEEFGQRVVVPEEFGQRVVVPEEFGQRVVVPEEFGQRVVVPEEFGQADAAEAADLRDRLARAVLAQQEAAAEVERLEARLREVTRGET